MRMKSKEQFERRYQQHLWLSEYKPGTLVLVRNTQVEKSLNRKSKPRYLGPFQVVRVTQNNSYIVQELDGSIWRQKIAAFRIIPFIQRKELQFSELLQKSQQTAHNAKILNEESTEEEMSKPEKSGASQSIKPQRRQIPEVVINRHKPKSS